MTNSVLRRICEHDRKHQSALVCVRNCDELDLPSLSGLTNDEHAASCSDRVPKTPPAGGRFGAG